MVTIDTSTSTAGDAGVVPVGMAHVASVVLTATVGCKVTKREEFGYFQFDRSDKILLFQAGIEPDIDLYANFPLWGSPLARCPGRPGAA